MLEEFKPILQDLIAHFKTKNMSQKSCRVLLLRVEIWMKLFIQDCAKFATKFKRNIIIMEDLEIVLDQLNIAPLFLGTSFLRMPNKIDLPQINTYTSKLIHHFYLYSFLNTKAKNPYSNTLKTI